MPKNPTIADIAEACGVSRATVSYVLNNKAIVGKETRERVLKAIEELNFRPSAVARALSSKRIDTLGVVFPNTTVSPVLSPYFGPVLDGIMQVALREHQNMTLYTGHDWIDSRSSLPLFRDGRTDGLILVAPRVDLDIVPALAGSGTPLVVIEYPDDDRRVSMVYVDDVAVGRQVTDHLIGLGHRRIAMVCGAPFAACVPRRQRGFEEAFAAAGLRPDDAIAIPGEFNRESVRERIDRILEMPTQSRPTAILCTNDELALGAIERLVERGVDVPGEMSVAGVDDVRGASTSVPKLTTVRQPLSEMGAIATEMLLAQIRYGPSVRYRKEFKTELVVRESTVPPA